MEFAEEPVMSEKCGGVGGGLGRQVALATACLPHRRGLGAELPAEEVSVQRSQSQGSSAPFPGGQERGPFWKVEVVAGMPLFPREEGLSEEKMW